MTAELGQQYLPFLLDVLESALPEKGYMGHVKGYTLHFILEALAKVCLQLPAAFQILPQTRTQLGGGKSQNSTVRSGACSSLWHVPSKAVQEQLLGKMRWASKLSA